MDKDELLHIKIRRGSDAALQEAYMRAVDGPAHLSDTELLEKCDKWVSRLCETRGKAWTLQAPANYKEDPDMLFTELSRRYKALIGKEVKDV